MIAKHNLTNLAAISAATVIALTGIITYSGGRFNGNWNKDGGSITIEGKQTPEKTNDCLPRGESSHHSECINR